MDALAFVLAVVLGALFVSPELHDNPDPWSATAVSVDVIAGALACLSLWWRRRFPVGVAVACLLFGTVSSSATPAGLLALSSLAVHRPARPAVLVTVLWVPSVLVYAAYSPTTGPGRWWRWSCRWRWPPPGGACSSALDASWCFRCANGRSEPRPTRSFARNRRGWQRGRGSPGRCTTSSLTGSRCWRSMPEGWRCGRTCLPNRCGRPRRFFERRRASARGTPQRGRVASRERRARTCVCCSPADAARHQPPRRGDPCRRHRDRLPDGRRAIGDLPAAWHATPTASCKKRSPTSQSTRREPPFGCGSSARPARATISVRNRQPVPAITTSTLPGSGAGLLGLQERVALAGGTLVVGSDGSGDFVVEAELTWRP